MKSQTVRIKVILIFLLASHNLLKNHKKNLKIGTTLTSKNLIMKIITVKQLLEMWICFLKILCWFVCCLTTFGHVDHAFYKYFVDVSVYYWPAERTPKEDCTKRDFNEKEHARKKGVIARVFWGKRRLFADKKLSNPPPWVFPSFTIMLPRVKIIQTYESRYLLPF